MNSQYFKDRDRKNLQIVDELCNDLPVACTEYFDGVSLARAPSTLASYARQLDTFFGWVHINVLSDKMPEEYEFEDLAKITSDDVMLFLHELKHSGDSDATLNSYLRTISAFYTYMQKRGKFQVNPVAGIIRPKQKKAPKIYLDDDDCDRFFDSVKIGTGLTDRESKYRDTIGSAIRDILIISLLADTGIRVSELVGLDVNDVDINRCRITVQRKGGNIDNVYFSDATLGYMTEYMMSRNLHVADGESALLLSYLGKNKGRRLSVRSVEIIVKKYASAAGVTNSGKMTPHKLRHTCAMSLLKMTKNIALVQKQLGHKSITSTTVYAEADDSDLEEIRNRNKN